MPETFGTVQFTEDVWKRIEEWTDLCSTEVAAMGYVKLDGAVALVDEVFLVPQVVSGSSVEFVESGFPWAVAKAMKEGRLDELRFCWHSHVNFAAKFSETDKSMIRKVRDSGPIPWFVSTILNKKGETWAQIDYFQTGDGLDVFCQHVPLPLDVRVGEPVEYDPTERELELEEFLTKKPTTVVVKGGTSVGKTQATLRDEVLDAPRGSVTEETVGPSGCTGADWKLHNRARTNGWASYIDPEDYVHYWDEKDGNKYKGCAPMPRNEDGSAKIAIDAVELDAETAAEIEEVFGDNPNAHLDPQTDEEVERMVDVMMARQAL